MQAVILTGGRGTRLRPFTFSLPKPLVPIGDRPIIDIVLSQLKRSGVKEAILSTGYLSELMRAYCGDGSRWNLPIRYVHEEKPLNTAGPLKLVKNLDDNFLVMNGDLLTTLDYAALWKAHLAARTLATIAVCDRPVPIDFGIVQSDSQSLLETYTEKPRLMYTVSMGINVLQRRALDYIQPGEAISMPDLLLRLKSKGENILCHKSSAEWLDIGRPEDYEAAQERFQSSRQTYDPGR